MDDEALTIENKLSSSGSSTMCQIIGRNVPVWLLNKDTVSVRTINRAH
jgi:hypothetical protein